MPWTPSNLIVKGVQNAFHQAMENAPSVWRNHCMELTSTAASETYAFPGFVPQPREFISGRQFVGLMDFSFSVANKRYELSFAIQRSYFADDQTGLIRQRINEAAEVVSGYQDYRFAALLTGGNVSGNNGFDGVTFHADTRVIGSSANIDNNLTAATTGPDAGGGTTNPTSAEFLLAIQDTQAWMMGYQDDTGRPFNAQAATKLRAIIPPIFMRPAMEAVAGTTILFQSPTTPFSPTAYDNSYGRGICEIDVLPYLTGTTEMFISAVGSSRLPFIHQSREPLEIVVDQSPETVAREDAIQVMCYWRDAFAYGEPRRSVLYTFS